MSVRLLGDLARSAPSAVLVTVSDLDTALQQTATHLSDYLIDQLHEDRLAAAAGSSTPPSAAVHAVDEVLRRVRDAAEEMSSLLSQAELAMLALAPTHQSR